MKYDNASQLRYNDKGNKYIGIFKINTPFEGCFVKITADEIDEARDLMRVCFPEYGKQVMLANTEEWGGMPAPDGRRPMGVIFRASTGDPMFCSFDEPEPDLW